MPWTHGKVLIPRATARGTLRNKQEPITPGRNRRGFLVLCRKRKSPTHHPPEKAVRKRGQRGAPPPAKTPPPPAAPRKAPIPLTSPGKWPDTSQIPQRKPDASQIAERKPDTSQLAGKASIPHSEPRKISGMAQQDPPPSAPPNPPLETHPPITTTPHPLLQARWLENNDRLYTRLTWKVDGVGVVA